MQLLERFNQLISAPLFKAGSEGISLVWLLKLLLSLLIVVVLINLLKRVLKDYVLLRLKFSQGNREVVSTLISYGFGSLCLLIVLSTNGLDLASLAVVLGGLGVGIGFGLQDLTKNLVSGLTLLLEGKLQVGDYIEFDGLSGYIKEISMRSTIVRTFDGGDVVIPNSSLVGNQVLNWSYKNFRGKLHLPISAAYDSDPIMVTETLLNSAYMEPSVLYDPPPRVIFKGFGESALNFELWVWVSQIDTGISVRSALNYIIEYNFRQAGIKMPFPQRELWLQNLEALAPKSDAEVQPGARSTALTTPKVAPPVSIRRVLKDVVYFQKTSDLHLRGIIEAGYRKALADAEALFQEEEMAEAVYIVLSGSIDVVSVRLNQLVKTYHAGEFFGEAPIMLKVPYIATGRAVGETSVFVIPKGNFEKLLNTCPALAETFAQEVSKAEEEYAGLRQQLQDLGFLAMAEHHNSFVNWVQTRLKSLFNVS
jgi:potassium-dependent mechanosensitive channel